MNHVIKLFSCMAVGMLLSVACKQEIRQTAAADIRTEKTGTAPAVTAQRPLAALGGVDCTGPNKRLINGVCQTGYKHYTRVTASGSRCYIYYVYVFSDGSTSGEYWDTSTPPCPAIPEQ